MAGRDPESQRNEMIKVRSHGLWDSPGLDQISFAAQRFILCLACNAKPSCSTDALSCIPFILHTSSAIAF